MIESYINSNNRCCNNTLSKNIFDESKNKIEVEKMGENADQLSSQFVDSSRCVGARFLEMAARWLPNAGEFFFSLASLIENAERQFSSAFYDTSEFLLRGLDEYERMLSTLQSEYSWESYGVNLLCKMLWQTLRTFAIVCPFFDRILSSDNDGEKKYTGETRLLRFVAFVHLPFIFRSFDLFVASRLFMKGISYCYKEKTRAVRSCYGKF